MLNTFAGIAVSGAGGAVNLGTRRSQWTRRTLIWLLNNLCNKPIKSVDRQAQHVVIIRLTWPTQC